MLGASPWVNIADSTISFPTYLAPCRGIFVLHFQLKSTAIGILLVQFFPLCSFNSALPPKGALRWYRHLLIALRLTNVSPTSSLMTYSDKNWDFFVSSVSLMITYFRSQGLSTVGTIKGIKFHSSFLGTLQIIGINPVRPFNR